ncbi:BREX protein BrxB domain-containing protein [Dyadobacter chenhuakuii]|uniref:DUF1788 domain-containing protein n=1 Tax=Dyadobacter chenhuakuii TaxID=2909339 RepID=A0ABY4XMH8_9BACT|nr:BREX protein BrxB domain-containing protein [Dyadobacter chenhuakuii]MCF2494279.1 DUF1788 domain-containing protein [Dyadobacter chenhuakuii]USJ31404.1 DUF1788 domain-containing protein [Dyadobacter chenhuakuii]
MESVEYKFKTMLDELDRPSTNHYAGDKQIYYLTFPPNDALVVKRKVETLTKLAEYTGWTVHVVSIAQVIYDFFRNNPDREIWLDQEQYYDALTIVSLFEDLGASVRNQRIVENAILAKQAELRGLKKAILLITDLECLHPYSRFGPIEQQLYSDIRMPIAVLYPGQLTGSSLDFLSIYPPDGSYRSKHL